METAFVTTNVLDMRAAPDHESERVSQVLFGEVVRMTSTRRGFARIRQADGYSGWVDRRFLTKVAAKAGKAVRRPAVVSTVQTGLFDSDGHSMPPHILYYGTVLLVGPARAGRTEVILPDGGRVFVKTASLRPIMKKRTTAVTGADLVRETRKFLGVPYLWGGIAPPGFDCSGLIRAIGQRFGIYLPRDTKNQIRVGRPVDRSHVRSGDLLFFDRHVGLAIGRDRLIHSSRGGGGVRINSLRPGDPDYREDLDRNFAQARRIV